MADDKSVTSRANTLLQAINRTNIYKMVQRWLLNIEVFFHSLGGLIENAERQLASNSNDTSEYMVRRLDEYERTVSTLLARLNENYENLPNVLRSFERFYVSD